MQLDIKKRWDYVWKSLTNPHHPWGEAVIARLVNEFLPNEELTGYSVEYHAMSTEFQSVAGTEVADRFILVSRDHVQKKLHFEFQAGDCRDIAYRVLKYGLAEAEQFGHTTISESWQLPYSAIVLVRAVPGIVSGERNLILRIGKTTVNIFYPVVRGDLCIPGVREAMRATSVQELQDAAKKLLSNLPYFYDNQSAVDEFNRIIYLLSNPKIFDSNPSISDKEVEWGMQDVSSVFTTAADKFREQGRDEMLQRVAKVMGISLEEARSKFVEATPSAGTKSNLNKMKL